MCKSKYTTAGFVVGCLIILKYVNEKLISEMTIWGIYHDLWPFGEPVSVRQNESP